MSDINGDIILDVPDMKMEYAPFVSRAAEKVQALVLGFPASVAAGRNLLMFQAYIDESISQGNTSPLFVMAGYISTAKRWTQFAEEWDKLLRAPTTHYPRPTSFKMSEMTSEMGFERCGHFYRIIEDHVYAAISCSIDIAALHRVVDSYDWSGLERPERLKNPYFIAFQAITTGLAAHQGKLGITGPIDLVFDDISSKGPCIEGWERIKQSAHSSVGVLMGDGPIFRKDETMLPLQAADLWAWWVRHWEQSGINHAVDGLKFPWNITKPNLLRLHTRLGEQDLRKKIRDVHRLATRKTSSAYRYVERASLDSPYKR